jgi:hypothetical protein
MPVREDLFRGAGDLSARSLGARRGTSAGAPFDGAEHRGTGQRDGRRLRYRSAGSTALRSAAATRRRAAVRGPAPPRDRHAGARALSPRDEAGTESASRPSAVRISSECASRTVTSWSISVRGRGSTGRTSASSTSRRASGPAGSSSGRRKCIVGRRRIDPSGADRAVLAQRHRLPRPTGLHPRRGERDRLPPPAQQVVGGEDVQLRVDDDDAGAAHGSAAGGGRRWLSAHPGGQERGRLGSYTGLGPEHSIGGTRRPAERRPFRPSARG